MSDRRHELTKAGITAKVKSAAVKKSTPFDLPTILGRLDGLERSGDRSLVMASVRDDSCTHLSRSLLVKLKLKIQGDERVNILCTTEDICSSGMLVYLPCQLGVNPGSVLDMDLFLGPDEDFVSLQGRTRRIARIGNEGAVAYVLEVDFQKVNGLVEKQIAAFIHSSQVESHRLTLAQ
jgi:hypothetical protein